MPSGYQKILVPIDNSEHAGWAMELARKKGALEVTAELIKEAKGQWKQVEDRSRRLSLLIRRRSGVGAAGIGFGGIPAVGGVGGVGGGCP